MSKDTGGPAFPREDYQANGHDRGFEKLGQEGMTLRDYFAAKALCGDWSSQNSSTGEFPTDADIEPLTKRAGLYYRMADAMIKARSAE